MIGSDLLKVLAGLWSLPFATARAKTFLAHSIGFGINSVEVIVAVMVQLLLCGVLRRPISSIWPWICVELLIVTYTALTVAADGWPATDTEFHQKLIGFALTLFLPTALMLLSRQFPRLWDRTA
jgi:hypothetical protein